MGQFKPRTIRPNHFEELHAKERANTHILYRCFDRDDVLLYVGMTNDPEERIKAHRKDKEWWSEVCYLTLLDLPNRHVLVDAEAIAIRTENPKFNKVIPLGKVRAAPEYTGTAARLWRDASTFCTSVPDYGFLIDMTLEQQLYPCVECHSQAIYNEGDTVACGMCLVEWTYDQWFDMTFNARRDTPHQLRLL